MQILGLGLSKKLVSSLTNEVLGNGFKIEFKDIKPQVLQDVKIQNYTCGIIDISGDSIEEDSIANASLVSLFKELVEKDVRKRVRWVLVTNKDDQNFIREMLSLGVVGFVPRNHEIKDSVIRIRGLLEQLEENYVERRGHVRVSPEDPKQVRFAIQLPNTEHFISGTMVNLSLSGALLECDHALNNYDSFVKPFLKPGELLEDVKINLHQKILLTDCKIIVIRDNLIGVAFLNDSTTFLNELSYYIYTCLTTQAMG